MRFSREYIEEIRNIDLLTYLQNYDPDELVKSSRNEYRTRTHGSLVISNGLWHWIARGIGGKSALDYLIHVKEMNFAEAVEHLGNCTHKKVPTVVSHKTKYKFKLPLPCQDTVITNYLCKKRCLSEEVVSYAIRHYYIYQHDSDVVFVGYDEGCKARFASVRSTVGKDRRDVAGSNKRYSFKLTFQSDSDVLNVYESPIDLLSNLSLRQLKGKAWRTQHHLSIGGAMRIDHPEKDRKLPIALEQYLKQYPQIKTINLYLDNDRAGRDTSELIKKMLDNSCEIIDHVPAHYKDINDELKHFICKRNEIER